MRRVMSLSWRAVMRRTAATSWPTLAMTLALVAGCGEPTDRQEDCTVNEYFDAVEQLCFTCPAVDEPSCRPGCGFAIERDDRGCPVATCDETCSMCGEGEVFSDEQLACVADTGAR